MDRKDLMLKHFGTTDESEYSKLHREDRAQRWDWRFETPEPLVKIPFPYYDPDPSLPPIPTAEECEKFADPEVLATLRDKGSNSIHRVHGVYGVKISGFTKIVEEAENLLFLRKHSGLRVPRVYAAYSHVGVDPWSSISTPSDIERTKGKKLYYLVMEWLDGLALNEEIFTQMSKEARVKIYEKAGAQVKLLRSMPPPHPTYYGRIHDQPFHRSSLVLGSRARHPVGPFHTYEALLDHLKGTAEVELLHKQWDFARPPPAETNCTQKLFLANFHAGFDEGPSSTPTLTHMDLKIDNMVLVRPASNASEKPEDWDLYIVDWEYMSWLPAWVETLSIQRRMKLETRLAPSGEREENHLPDFTWYQMGAMKPFYFAPVWWWVEVYNRVGGGSL